METKRTPNPNGCLAKALPDEPFFVLLARDVTAPATIRWWAERRAQLGVETEKRQDAEQLQEALDTATVMEIWRIQNDGRWRNSVPTADCVIWSNEHQAWWRPDSRGYAARIEEAGLYSLEQATRICREANYGGTLNEVAFPRPAIKMVADNG